MSDLERIQCALQLIKEKALERLETNTVEWADWYCVAMLCDRALFPTELSPAAIRWGLQKIEELDALT